MTAPGPDQTDDIHAQALQAFGLLQAGRLSDAASIRDRLIAADPDHPDALHLAGALAHQAGDGRCALAMFDRALAADPGNARIHFNRGTVLAALDDPAAAADAYGRAGALFPAYGDAHLRRGAMLLRLGRTLQALESFGAAAAAAPTRAEPHLQRADILSALGRHDDALAAYDAALARDATAIGALHGRSLALLRLQRVAEAVIACDRVLATNPRHVPCLIVKGNALRGLRRHGAAVRCFDDAIAAAPGDAIAHYGRANTLFEMRRYEDAAEGYRAVAQIDPDFEFIAGTEFFARLMTCDWSSTEDARARIADGIRAAKPVVMPFASLSMLDDPELHRRCAETFVARRLRFAEPSPLASSGGERIKLGYFSSDYHAHATTSLIAQLFEVHDRAAFEVAIFSYGPAAGDTARARIRAGADAFHEIARLSDSDVAALARRLGLDIAIDLKGYTAESRVGMFALRCAPVQMSYLGYPGTLALPGMDYIVADSIVAPPGSDAHYTEKIIRLPGSYQVNDGRRPSGQRVWTRRELGLPEHGFVFACFNNNFKILPETFEGWMRIPGAVPGSVLWLLEDTPRAAANLRAAAQARGIDPVRIVFAPRMETNDHIARHRCADLFLDTLPYNAHTTASDALWAGLPVLTRTGRSFPARVAASLLHALGLPELVTRSQADYEATAIALATEPASLSVLRARVASNRNAAPLFDAARFARNLEAAYRAVHDRHLRGLPPAAIDLSARDVDDRTREAMP